MNDDIWPETEYAESYPVDEDFEAIRAMPLDFTKAAFWLYTELPRAAENMPCICDVEQVDDDLYGPCYQIAFSTGGWSGAESITSLIESRADLAHFMQSWRRGGHYVFQLPTKRSIGLHLQDAA